MKKPVLLLKLSLLSLLASAQLTLLPNGNNQSCTVIQGVGLAEIRIDYSSPDVDGRRGEIWGDLVPYNEGEPFPWRAGANENTRINFSHHVKIDGNKLAAGSYGFHVIPSEKEWTLIFSNDKNSWGSFTYDKNNDALRIKVTPKENEFTEYLTYSFPVKKSDHTVCQLAWEDLMIQFKISVDEKQLMAESLRADLRRIPAGPISWKEWSDAASISLSMELGNYEEALRWANRAVVFSPNFQSYLAKYGLHIELGQDDEAKKAWEKAMLLGSNEDLYRLGRSFVASGDSQKALEVFQRNQEKFDRAWPVDLGLGRGYEAVGDKKAAKKYYQRAMEVARTNRQKSNLERLIANLD